jgi:hypothetical protein
LAFWDRKAAFAKILSVLSVLIVTKLDSLTLDYRLSVGRATAWDFLESVLSYLRKKELNWQRLPLSA